MGDADRARPQESGRRRCGCRRARGRTRWRRPSASARRRCRRPPARRSRRPSRRRRCPPAPARRRGRRWPRRAAERPSGMPPRRSQLRAQAWMIFPPRGGSLPVFILFPTLTGLADGLALKELRYAADAGDSPQLVGPPLPAICGGDSAEVGGTLANAKTGKCAEVRKGPLRRGPFLSGPVSRILS